MCEQFEKFRGDDSKNSFSEILRFLFTAFMECDTAIASTQINILISRLKIELITSPGKNSDQQKNIKRKIRENSFGSDFFETNSDDFEIRNLMIHLNTDYPNDLGALCPLILNYITLAEGEAFFMGSNEPHAYISGE